MTLIIQVTNFKSHEYQMRAVLSNLMLANVTHYNNGVFGFELLKLVNCYYCLMMLAVLQEDCISSSGHSTHSYLWRQWYWWGRTGLDVWCRHEVRPKLRNTCITTSILWHCVHCTSIEDTRESLDHSIRLLAIKDINLWRYVTIQCHGYCVSGSTGWLYVWQFGPKQMQYEFLL